MAELKDILWKNVPQPLKNNQLIKGYIDSVGEEYETIRLDIEKQKYANDYAKSKDIRLDDISSSVGIDNPPRIKDEIKRLLIRDSNDIVSRLGTRGALEWVLKYIGIREFTIREIWVPNPGLIKKGFFKTIGVDGTARYEVSSNSFRDFYLGEPVVKQSGPNAGKVFFEGFPFTGNPESNLVTDIPIYGETYDDVSSVNFDDIVSKTPYLSIKADDFDFSRIILPVDEDNQNISDEKVQILLNQQDIIISDIIDYFVQTIQRTATTRYIFILDDFSRTDSIPPIGDDLVFAEGIDFFFEEGFSVKDEFNPEGTLLQNSDEMQIGNNWAIGSWPMISTTFYNTFDINNQDVTHDIDFTKRRVNDTSILITEEFNFEGYRHFVYTDIAPTVSFTAPSSSNVIVYTRTNSRISSTETQFTEVTAGSSFNETFGVEINAVILELVSNTNEKITINIEYN